MSTVSEDLMPCPFCGGTKVFLRDADRHNVWIECDDCQTGTLGDDMATFLSYSDGIDNVKDRWNRRPDTAADDGWIKWKGGASGEPPVDPRTLIFVKLRGVIGPPQPVAAGQWDWAHRPKILEGIGDIIAYRIVPTQAPDKAVEL